MLIPHVGGSLHLPIAYHQVRTNDHADVVNLQSLTGMNAADLLDGLLRNDP